MKTAGVYLRCSDRFAFQFGPNKDTSRNGIARFGGHIEPHETAIECAVREVREEAGVAVDLEDSERTFYQSEDDQEPVEITPVQVGGVVPIYLFGGTATMAMSVMYFGNTRTMPVPTSETVAIALLSRSEIVEITEKPMTTGELLDSGAYVLEYGRLDRDRLVSPLRQLGFLGWAIRNGYV